ncbi:MAG: glucose PTS transporter subunit EIIB [Ancrocorticia sp.]|nr:glucose PTS transporter subunit EIIB [Ancrocorticia sp.]MCI2001648.1 glucose PTS transporter subunit EIIB [Ancrocorticia sp.]
MGVVFFFVYLGLFYFLIKKFNLKTPGRGEEIDADEGTTFGSDANFADMAAQILKGLGGKANIDSLDYCATRLRVVVNDYTQVNESEIKKAGVAGVIRPSQKSVQVIVGPQVQFVFDEANEQIK